MTFAELAEKIGPWNVSHLYLFSDKENRAEITVKDLENNKSLEPKLKKIEFERDFAVHFEDGEKFVVYCGGGEKSPISETDLQMYLEEAGIRRVTYHNLTKREVSGMNYPPECILHVEWPVPDGTIVYSTLPEKERAKVMAIHSLVTEGGLGL